MNKEVWIIRYTNLQGRESFIVFNNEIYATLGATHLAMKGQENVKVYHEPVYEKYLWDRHAAEGTPVHIIEKGVSKNKREYTKIYCCGDCINYDWKKHRCKRGASEEGKPTDNFFRDCPNGLYEEEVMNK